MAIIVDTVPQNVQPISLTTFGNLISVLPEELDYPLNVWIGGKLARYGQTSDNLMFLVEQDDETSTELKLYFEKISEPYIATVSHKWKDEKISAIRLYNEGKLIIDKNTLTYKELPSPVKSPPIIHLQEVLDRLPKTVNWEHNIYLTGSLVKCGWSGKDVDFMVDSEDTKIFAEIRNYFGNLLGCRVDVGNAEMPERNPVYKFLLYTNKTLQIR